MSNIVTMAGPNGTTHAVETEGYRKPLCYTLCGLHVPPSPGWTRGESDAVTCRQCRRGLERIERFGREVERLVALQNARKQKEVEPFGRKLDAFVAEKLFGWRRARVLRPAYMAMYTMIVPPGPVASVFEGLPFLDPANGEGPLYPYSNREGTFLHYSTEISDAWKIVELYQEQSIGLEVRPYVGVTKRGYRVGIWFGRELGYVIGATAPLAICRAVVWCSEQGDEHEGLTRLV